MKHKFFFSLGLASSILLLGSCQDEEFGYTADQIAYQSNFEKAFGKVSEIPTWDLSSYNLKQLGLKGGPSNDFAAIGGAQTRAFNGDASNIVSDYDNKWYTVQTKTTDWLNEKLAEKVEHKDEGSPFTLINPYYDEDNSGNEDRDFLIIPIYQGASGMCWDLHLVDDQYDYTIWSKSKNFKYTVKHNEWEEYFYHDLESMYIDNEFKYQSVIKIGSAFENYKTVDGAQIFFELNAGTMKGYFVIQQKIGNNYHLAFASDELTFTSSDSRDANAKSLSSLGINVGSEFTSTTNKDQKVTVESNYANLYFLPTEQMKGVVIDPYPAQRLHIYVKTNDTESEPRYTYNFVEDKSHSGDGEFSLGYPAYDHEEFKNTSNNVSYFEGHTINRSNVQSKVMKINTKNLGREFTLYLETKYSDKYNTVYAERGDKHRSNGDPKMMLALHEFNKPGATDSEKPIDITSTLTTLGLQNLTGVEYMVVGCEDAAHESDWDYNDVVLLIIGMPKVPKIATEVIQKRYMIEDLGSTFDFDFNDIVVDVTQEKIVTLGTGTVNEKQVVSIAHLCGTIPFDIHFKNTDNTTTSIFGKLMGNNGGDMTGGDGYDPKTDNNYKSKYIRTYTSNFPWRPNDNNVVVYVWPNAAGLTEATGSGNSSIYETNKNLLDIKAAQQISFPKTGEFPYIIAVDQDINWMPELCSVPKAWFKTEYVTDEDPNIHIPTNPEAIPNDIDLSKYGTLVTESYMTDNHGNGTRVSLGSLLNGNYLNPGRELTFTVVMSATCLPENINNSSTALPEVKGEFYVNGNSSIKLNDAVVHLKDFASPSDNNQIIIQKFTLNDPENLTVSNVQNLIFDITYSTYGFTNVGSGNTKALLYVDWDKKPNLTFNLADGADAYSITINGDTKEFNNSRSVEFSVESGITINAQIKYKSGDSSDKKNWNAKYEFTEVGGSVLQNYYNNIVGGSSFVLYNNMSATNTSVSIEAGYQVQIYSRNDNPSNSYSNSQNPYGSVWIEYDGQNMGSNAYLPKGASFILHADPNNGNVFDGWYQMNNDANRESADNPRAVERSADATTYFRNAVFKIANVIVTAKPSGWGGVRIGNTGDYVEKAEGNYSQGTELTLYAQANTGYSFVQWSNRVTQESRNLTVGTTPSTPDAIFAYDLYTISWNLQNGTNNDNGGYYKYEKDYNYSFTTDNSTLIFYIKDDNNGMSEFNNANFEFYKKNTSDRIYPNETYKRGNRLLVNMKDHVNEINNGFYMIVKNMSNGAQITVEKVCVGPTANLWPQQ